MCEQSVVVTDSEGTDAKEIPFNPQWLGCFASGDGSFMIQIEHKGGKSFPRLIFLLTQHIRDEKLMVRLITYLGCGGVSQNSKSTSAVKFRVSKFTDIYEMIIPLLRENLVLGVKSKDFDVWCTAAEIHKSKGHLTPEGLDKINQLKANMNKSREN